jgi:hypothetical protein
MRYNFLQFVILAIALLLSLPAVAVAHCDGMDGPVVQAAQKALENGDVSLVLAWVQKEDEAAVSEAFEKTLAVRKLSPESKELADRYFFETLVRIHRAGEGAPYTGLRPAGRDLGPAIPAADEAIKRGSIDRLTRLLTSEVTEGLRDRFERVLAKKRHATSDVSAGREYVKAYVEFIHYAERVHQATQSAGHGHELEGPGPGNHHED